MDNVLDLLQQAITTLSQGGSIKDRLADAYATHLIQLDVDDLPEQLRSEFESMCAAMCRERPLPRESAIRASVRKMSNEEASRHAELVVRIFAAAARTSTAITVRRSVRNPVSSPIVNLFAADA